MREKRVDEHLIRLTTSQHLTCSSSLSKGLMLIGNLSPNYAQGLERHTKDTSGLETNFPQRGTLYQSRLDYQADSQDIKSIQFKRLGSGGEVGGVTGGGGVSLCSE